MSASFEKLTDDIIFRLLPQIFTSWVQMNPNASMETALSHPLKYLSVLHYDMEHDRVQGTLESAFEFLALDTATNETIYDQMYDNLGAFKFFLAQTFKGASQEEIAGKVSEIYDNLSVQATPIMKDTFMALFLTDKAMRGTNANDTILVSEDNDDITHHILTKDGNDTVTASKEDDYIVGGKGNDTLNGDDGNDTYIYNKGDGQDIIIENWVRGKSDKLNINGYNASSATFQLMSKNDYYGFVKMTFNTTDSIEIAAINDREDDYYEEGIETIKFDDITLTKKQIREKVISNQQTTGNDIVHGFGRSDDIISAGKGNDTLMGEGNDDTYIYNKGDGQDIIVENWIRGKADKLVNLNNV